MNDHNPSPSYEQFKLCWVSRRASNASNRLGILGDKRSRIEESCQPLICVIVYVCSKIDKTLWEVVPRRVWS